MISVCVPVYNRCRVPSRLGVQRLLPRCLRTVKAASAQAGEPVEIVIADGGSTDVDYSRKFRSCRVVSAPGPFSLGRLRNVAIRASTGDVLVVLDADMLIPPDFLKRMAELCRHGFIGWPQYHRELAPGGPLKLGNGYGNICMPRAAYDKVVAKSGHGYGESTSWGGEDTEFGKRLYAVWNHSQFWRKVVPGFVHQWHPKPKTEAWYAGRDKTDDNGVSEPVQ